VQNRRRRTSNWIRLLYLCGFVFFSARLGAQDLSLDRERERLEREQTALDAEKQSFNAECGRVRPDETDKLRACKQRKDRFLARLQKYTQDLKALQERSDKPASLQPESDLRDAVASTKLADSEKDKRVLQAIRSSLNSPGELYAKCTRRFRLALSDLNLRETLQLIYGEYHGNRVTTDEVRNRLISQAALEQARTRAIEDLQADVTRLKNLHDMLERGRQQLEADPAWRGVFGQSSDYLREIEQEARRRMEAGLVIPDDQDLFLLFEPNFQVRIWPGPKNPDDPLPNPLATEAQFQKICQLVRWERREQVRVDHVFNSLDQLMDYLVEDVMPDLAR